jgi:hypothetical protein
MLRDLSHIPVRTSPVWTLRSKIHAFFAASCYDIIKQWSPSPECLLDRAQYDISVVNTPVLAAAASVDKRPVLAPAMPKHSRRNKYHRHAAYQTPRGRK